MNPHFFKTAAPPSAHTPDAAECRRRGRVALERGQVGEAVVWLRRACYAAPSADLAKELGVACQRAGDAAGAERAYRDALRLDPRHVAANNNLGLLKRALGDAAGALPFLRRASEAAPDDAEVHANLGVVLFELGRVGEAADSLRRAAASQPDDPLIARNLAMILRTAHDFAGSAAVYAALLRREPGDVALWVEAARMYRHAGDLAAAIATAEGGLAHAGDDAARRSDLAGVLLSCGALEAATAALERATTLDPAYAGGHHNLAIAYCHGGRPAAALAHAERACALEPAVAENWLGLANVHRELGANENALRAQLAAVERRPDDPALRSNALYTLHNLDAVTPAEILERHRDYGRAVAAVAPPAAYANERRADRPLRIGYVSGDFRDHSAMAFFMPLLAHHDRARYACVLFSTHSLKDETSARLRRLADGWVDCWTLSDDELCAAIAAAGIDILVDLSGHTAMNRLPVFARKPAPVAMSWLGYPGTTGIAAIDYCLSDAVLDPPDQPLSPYAETLVRLPVFSCYRPPDDELPVPPRAADAGRAPVFASFQPLAKLSPATVALWSELLHAVPAARLLIVTRGGETAPPRQLLAARFGQHGIGAERLDIRGLLPFGDYLAAHGDVDFFLDTLPWNGHTTTCHAFWMGVPTLTLAGDRRSARMGAALSRVLGLDDFVADTPAEFVAKGVAAAADGARLDALRRSLRGRLLASPLCDGPAFARSIEAVYQDAWRRWCAQLR